MTNYNLNAKMLWIAAILIVVLATSVFSVAIVSHSSDDIYVYFGGASRKSTLVVNAMWTTISQKALPLYNACKLESPARLPPSGLEGTSTPVGSDLDKGHLASQVIVSLAGTPMTMQNALTGLKAELNRLDGERTPECPDKCDGNFIRVGRTCNGQGSCSNPDSVPTSYGCVERPVAGYINKLKAERKADPGARCSPTNSNVREYNYGCSQTDKNAPCGYQNTEDCGSSRVCQGGQCVNTCNNNGTCDSTETVGSCSADCPQRVGLGADCSVTSPCSGTLTCSTTTHKCVQ